MKFAFLSNLFWSKYDNKNNRHSRQIVFNTLFYCKVIWHQLLYHAQPKNTRYYQKYFTTKKCRSAITMLHYAFLQHTTYKPTFINISRYLSQSFPQPLYRQLRQMLYRRHIRHPLRKDTALLHSTAVYLYHALFLQEMMNVFPDRL